MTKEVISSKQGISIMFMFLIGTTLVTGSANKSKQDAWIAILIAMVIALPIVWVYSKLLQLFPGKNLFDILEEVFGKFIGKILTLIYTWYFFHLGSLVIRNITEFIQIASLSDTPQFFTALFIGLIVIYMVKSGIEVLGRWTEFILPIIILTFILSISLSVPRMNFNNIKPILYSGFKPVFQDSSSIFAFPFAETVIFTVLFSSLEKKSKSFKVYFLSTLLCGIVILFVAIRNIFVIGPPAIAIQYFTSYYAVSLINIGDFLQRIEAVISTIVILCSIAKTSVCLLAVSIGVSKIFNLDNYRPVVAPIGLLMLNLSFIVYKSTMEMFEWIDTFYLFYAIPFQIILPLIIWIVAEVKKSSMFRMEK